ncbi:hypothetical protein J6590_038095 [Homalodisca vitripennis]|nr:hypothetical protein J6590_038095 [Homalodisca vitripennis]
MPARCAVLRTACSFRKKLTRACKSRIPDHVMPLILNPPSVVRQNFVETDKIFELDTTHDIKFLEPTNATSSLLKNHTHVENETDLPTNSIQELEQSLLANDPKNNGDSLILAAKIGSVINVEAKIEDLLSCEETYIRRTEQLQQQLAEMELQRIKDREHILEIQQIFEDNDKKQVVQLNEYEFKIKEQENKIFSLKKSLSRQQEATHIGDKIFKSVEVQTEKYSNSPVTQTSLIIEMGMLKKNYSAMEQKITVLEMEVQSLHKIKTSKSTGGKSGELNKSSNSNKTFGRRPGLGH